MIFLVLICKNLCSQNFSLYGSCWYSVHDMFESLTRINNIHTYTTYYCSTFSKGGLYKMAVSAQNSWTSTYDTTNRSTCNFITRSTSYTQELSLIRTNLTMTKFKQLVSLCEGRKSCDTGMGRYHYGKRKVHYQQRAMLMITCSPHSSSGTLHALAVEILKLS